MIFAAICCGLWFICVKQPKPLWPVIIICAIGTWYGFYIAGIHPVLLDVILSLLVPTHPKSQKSTDSKTKKSASLTEKFHQKVLPYSSLCALPLFAFFSMGISLNDFALSWLINPVFIGIVVGLLMGKPCGILIMTKVCALFGLQLAPENSTNEHTTNTHVPNREMIGVAQLAGIGFTMSFLITQIAFSNPVLTHIGLLVVVCGSVLSFVSAAIIMRHKR